ncbi:MAG: tetratricopeptide repeat protein [Streptosporangiaceae bacterium]
MVAQRAGAPPPSGLLVSGIIPPLADPYFQRQETGVDLRSGLFPGQIAVLTHGEQSEAAPAEQGGTGKTQLAAEFMHALRGSQAVEILIWISALNRESVVAGLAQAAELVGAGNSEADAEAAATALMSWLARTDRPWALVIDDLADLADLRGLWPSGPAGRVVITTRLPAAGFGSWAASARGGDPGAGGTPGLEVVPVGGFSRREALAYLGSRLTDDPDQRVEALDLGEDLDGLPLGLAQAAAVMNVNRLSCREYRIQLAERRKHMTGQLVEGVSAAVLATWSLAAECAHALVPASLAWPALALAAMLDPHGIPGGVLTSPAACGYIAGRPSSAGAADQNMARVAITNLARVGLVSIDPSSPVRTVRMHPSVRAAVRAYLPPADLEYVLLAAADALAQTWPEPGSLLPGGAAGSAAELEAALRDCAASLQAAESGQDHGTQAYGTQAHGAQAGEALTGEGAGAAEAGRAGDPGEQARTAENVLWQPDAHPLLFRLGRSLEDSGLSDSAMGYWQSMVAISTRRLGPAHATTLAARDRLAIVYESAGRFGDAIATFAGALADRDRSQGTEHPDSIAARGRLAHAYSSAGRPAEAVVLYEHMVSDASMQLGLGHPVTLTARAGLAEAYQAAGRGKESLAAYRSLVGDCDRMLGPRHPTTLGARDSLAAAFADNGQPGQAIDLYKRLLADYEAMGGPDHADTIAARANLASAFRRGGKPKDAIAQYRRVLADRELIAGPDHPDTMAARANLAFAYRTAGQLREAIPGYERTLADRERVQGPDHADTRAARCNLAAAYQQAGRSADAIGQYEQALADCERLLGPGDLETLTTRSSVAAALFAAGRLMEVVTVLQRTLADSERYLGSDHPMTQTVRDNLEAATRT